MNRRTIPLAPTEVLKLSKSPFSAHEIDFVTSNEPIRIVPNFNLSKILLITGDIGPLRSGIPIQVPLWLAIHLKRKCVCRILIPDWMQLKVLERLISEEKNSPGFTKLPSDHYMQIAVILFDTCLNDITDADSIRTAIKDLWDIRESKMRTSIGTFVENGVETAKVNNITMMEIANFRPYFPLSTHNSYRISKTLRLISSHKRDQIRSMRVTANSQNMTESFSEDTNMDDESQTHSQTFSQF